MGRPVTGRCQNETGTTSQWSAATCHHQANIGALLAAAADVAVAAAAAAAAAGPSPSPS